MRRHEIHRCLKEYSSQEGSEEDKEGEEEGEEELGAYEDEEDDDYVDNYFDNGEGDEVEDFGADEGGGGGLNIHVANVTLANRLLVDYD